MGLDGETNVSPDYHQGDYAFGGKIIKVTSSRSHGPAFEGAEREDGVVPHPVRLCF